MAEEANPTAGVSEGDPSASGDANPGASGDGGATATTPTATAESLATAERERQEQARRDLQSERDRERAAREKAERELAALKGSTSKPEADTPLTRAELLATLDARDRAVKLREAASSFRASDDFKFADKAIFDKADQFDSVEALKAAAEQSHAAAKSVIDSTVEAQVQARLEEASKQYGFQLAPAPADNPTTPTGDPTMAQLAAMSMDEFDQVPQEVIDRVMSNAQTTVTS